MASGVPSAVLRRHLIGQGHPEGSMYDCEQCGVELARFLRSLVDQGISAFLQKYIYFSQVYPSP